MNYYYCHFGNKTKLLHYHQSISVAKCAEISELFRPEECQNIKNGKTLPIISFVEPTSKYDIKTGQ